MQASFWWTWHDLTCLLLEKEKNFKKTVWGIPAGTIADFSTYKRLALSIKPLSHWYWYWLNWYWLNYNYFIQHFFWVSPDSGGNFYSLILAGSKMPAERRRGALEGAVASGCPWGPPRVYLDQTHPLWCKRTDLWAAALDASAVCITCWAKRWFVLMEQAGRRLGPDDWARGRREAAVAYRKPPYRTLPRVYRWMLVHLSPRERAKCICLACRVSSMAVVGCRLPPRPWLLAVSLSAVLAAAHPSACSALYTMPSRYSKPDALAIVCDAHGEQSLQSGRLWVLWWCIAFSVLY